MTMTTATGVRHIDSLLDRRVAVRLAATEYERFAALLRSLSPEHWSTATECAGWDVRAMAGHLLGMAEMAATVRETKRQSKAAHAAGGVFIDALTALQVREHAQLSPDEVVARYATAGPRAARGRRRTPWFVRRRTLPEPQRIGGAMETWTVGYLVDVILTRDPWMHRVDIARATGVPLDLTADHDGVLVDDVVRDWGRRHGRSVTLHLTGPAGGDWVFGTEGPSLEYDAIEFCRLLSGRGDRGAPFDTEVPF